MENDKKWCPGYGRDRHEASISDFYRNKSRDDGLSPRCVECTAADNRDRNQRLRQQAIDVLGGHCSSPTCAVLGGMADPRALQFDHIDGGGRRRQQNGEHGHKIIKAILSGSTEFQLLCANCNWIKKHELAECVGDRKYERTIPTERVWASGKGIGRGNSTAGRSAIGAGWWATATPDQIAERNAKISKTKRSKPR